LKKLSEGLGISGFKLQHQLLVAQHCRPVTNIDARDRRKVPERRKKANLLE
jgi:hypothetical protein